MMQQALDIAHLQLSFIMTVPQRSQPIGVANAVIVSQILSRLQRQNESAICSMSGQPSQLGQVSPGLMDPPDPPHRASASNVQLDPDSGLEWAGGAFFSFLRLRVGGDSGLLTN
jgi:hypothetical protein